jgi:hypothetical protein
MPRTRWAAAAAVAGLVGIVSAGCTVVEQAEHEPYPAVTIADGADDAAPKTLTLTPDAVRRLDLTTVVLDDPKALPYAAVIYDKKGASWVYTNTQDRTFIRVPVNIDRVQDQTAVLTAGPPRGSRVVTRAAIKLYGAETGVGGGH